MEINSEFVTKMPALVFSRNDNSTLKILLSKHYPQLEVSSITAKQLGLLPEAATPAILFLDPEHAEKSLLQLVNNGNTGALRIIFTAPNEGFAMHAFRLSAVDYLLKPIRENELRRAVLRAINWPQAQPTPGKTPSSVRRDKLALPVFNGISFITIGDILYCESSNNYTYFYMRTGERILVSRTLKEFQEQLSQHSFFRIHQKYLVNLCFVNHYVRGRGGYIVMENSAELPVSVRKKDTFLSLVGSL